MHLVMEAYMSAYARYRWCGIWTRSIVSLSFSICRLTVLHVKVICFVRLFASGVGPSSSALKAAFRSSSGVQRYQFALSLWKRSNARKFSCFFAKKIDVFFANFISASAKLVVVKNSILSAMFSVLLNIFHLRRHCHSI